MFWAFHEIRSYISMLENGAKSKVEERRMKMSFEIRFLLCVANYPDMSSTKPRHIAHCPSSLHFWKQCRGHEWGSEKVIKLRIFDNVLSLGSNKRNLGKTKGEEIDTSCVKTSAAEMKTLDFQPRNFGIKTAIWVHRKLCVFSHRWRNYSTNKTVNLKIKQNILPESYTGNVYNQACKQCGTVVIHNTELDFAL